LPRGPDFLLVAETGDFKGKYFAITSKLVASIPEQLSESDWVSVVVHEIRRPGPAFRPDSLEDDYAFAMAVIERLH